MALRIPPALVLSKEGRNIFTPSFLLLLPLHLIILEALFPEFPFFPLPLFTSKTCGSQIQNHHCF